MKYVYNALQHFKTINHHKKLVMQGCFRLGLYWQGLTHDLSKYTWPEFRTGVLYYMDGQSPHNGERRRFGYSTAWLHHKGRNRHQAEYWIDYTADPDPDDRHIAGNYRGSQYRDCDPLEYYEKRKSYMIVHEDTRKQLEILLHMLARRGEDETFAYIRRSVLRNNHWEKLQHIFGKRCCKLQQLSSHRMDKF